MSVSHVEENVLAYGPPNPNLPGNPVNYYINPIGLQHIILSASELDESSVLSTEEPKAFSAQAVLKRSGGSSQSITYPVVQGMGYVTGVYSDLQPLVESGIFFRKVVNSGSPKPGIFKYQLFLEDDTIWLLYAAPDDGKDPQFQLVSTSSLRGPPGFTGTIQVAKNPADKAGEKFYDNSAGVYPVAGAVTGAVTGTVGTYGLSWTKAGKNATDTPLIMFALPHHVESFDASTSGRATEIHLRTTTKGNATAVIGDNWVMTEPDLPMDMGFAPWSPTNGSVHTLSASAQQSIAQIAPVELQQDINGQTNLNSMYYSGKALSKFATLIWTASNLGNNSDVASAALVELKKSFARFVQNQQQYPLAYDSVWKGVVSTAGYDGDLNADFGNTAYNDHHFHYGYFIQAAAIIGSLDPTWLTQNKDWVNMLVRDAGNSIEDDPYFPFSRSFDWFNGHSWAKGLFESFDGKDQESTSEDTMFAYAVKMWGQTTGDASMEARGNMMLAILRRSLNNYFLMQSNNTNQPGNFIANKVTGILFENKVDHTTYFGSNLEYIQGIHMLPLLPNSGYTRQQQFVAEEWQAIFAANASTPATKVDGGWKGVLFANLALVDPQASWDFFAQQEFDYSWIDGGASRTWYLAYAAGEFLTTPILISSILIHFRSRWWPLNGAQDLAVVAFYPLIPVLVAC
jgi:endo-1,3(4)-beta-glucanase